MKILHIIKPFTESGSADTIIQDQEAPDREVTVVRLKEDKDFDGLIEKIFASDKVFSW